MNKRLFITLFIVCAFSFAQTDFDMGDKDYRKTNIHSGNKVRTVFSNYGLVAGTVGGYPEGEWPIGSGNHYVGDVSPLLGFQLPRNWTDEFRCHGDGCDTLVNVFDGSFAYLDTAGIYTMQAGERIYYGCYNFEVIGDSLVHCFIRDTVYSVATSDGPRGNTDGPGVGGLSWTFEPVPGFSDPDTDLVALSSDLDNDGLDGIPNTADDDGKPDSWPWFWPDKMLDEVDPGWAGKWNGYFGKDILSADQESYFIMDDSRDYEFNYLRQGDENTPLVFLPDPYNPLRFGVGLQTKVRGLQWAHFLAEDAIFWIYEVKNISVHNYNKAVFGMMVGSLSGGRCQDHIDAQDDISYFDIENDITYSWDAPPGYSPCFNGPVGYAGYAFLESPGNPYNGIDDDDDSVDDLSPRFNESDFGTTVISNGMTIVLIDETTFDRTLYNLVNLPDTVVSMGQIFILDEGDSLYEYVGNLIDDDLDGIIDEDYWVHYRERLFPAHGLQPKPAAKYINYVTGDGLNDQLIDESREDGVDNDGDWDVFTDDIGSDGVAGTGDSGEGDNLPSPGEPNFDALDIDESDQIGLTSFNYFTPPGAVRMNDDYKWDSKKPGDLWKRMTPGNFSDIELTPCDGDFIYGSGYFPMLSGETQSYSMALLFGEDFEDILNNKITIQQIYNENYKFTKPPNKPSLIAVAGDQKVILYWDDEAEYSVDPIVGEDFEGYKIYRSTDFGFNEINEITSGYGVKQFYKPIAQFDKVNGIKGFFRGDITQPGVDGMSFYLGNDIGIQHSWTDTTVSNGQRYFYAIVSYDHGSESKGIYPAECTKTIQELNEVLTFDVNTVSVVPNAKSLGYVQEHAGQVQHLGSGTGNFTYEIIDPHKLPEGESRWDIYFWDSSNDGIDNNRNWDSFDDINDNGVWDEGEPLNDDLGTDGIGPDSPNYSAPDADGSQGNGQADAGEPDFDENDPTEYFLRIATFYSLIDATDGSSPDTLIFESSSLDLQSADDISRLESEFGVDNFVREIKPSTLFRKPKDMSGVRLFINNDWIPDVSNNSGWTSGDEGQYKLNVKRCPGGYLRASDYLLTFYDQSVTETIDTSLASIGNFHPDTVNCNVVNTTYESAVTIGYKPVSIGSDIITKGDTLVFFEPTPNGTLYPTWMLIFKSMSGQSIQPGSGSVYTLYTTKSYNSNDYLSFSIEGPGIDRSIASDQMERIHVVPNPYRNVEVWEPQNPFFTGRGTRKIDFVHVPPGAEIKIFTVRGELVKTLRHEGSIYDGTVSWDMRSRDNLDVAYGVYIYHVKAPGISKEKVGKFAIIK